MINHPGFTAFASMFFVSQVCFHWAASELPGQSSHHEF